MIELNNIELSFEEKKVFQDFSMLINKGEKVAITGRSGIGKSSILNMVAGFLKPQAGDIQVDNLKMHKTNIRKIRSRIAWLPQNFNVLGTGMVETIIKHPFTFHANKHSHPDNLTIEENLAKVDLSPDILKNSFENLSGGERQRIGLIICKLLKREIILLDEPTSALDKESIDHTAEFILADNDSTVLSVSHNEAWLKKCTRVIEL